MKKILGTLVTMLLPLMFSNSVVAKVINYQTRGEASYYADAHQGKLTANGERFNMNGLTAAHKTLPLGSKIKVTNISNGKSVVVRINDRGPYTKGRVLDLSKGAAIKLGMIETGTANVNIEVL